MFCRDKGLAILPGRITPGDSVGRMRGIGAAAKRAKVLHRMLGVKELHTSEMYLESSKVKVTCC